MDLCEDDISSETVGAEYSGVCLELGRLHDDTCSLSVQSIWKKNRRREMSTVIITESPSIFHVNIDLVPETIWRRIDLGPTQMVKKNLRI